MRNVLAVSMVMILVMARLRMTSLAQTRNGRIRLVAREVSLDKPTPPVLHRQTLFVSPNHRRVAYVRRWGGKKVPVVDGVEGKAYDEFLESSGIAAPCPPSLFDSSTSLHALALRDGEVFRVKVEIVAG